MVWPMDVPVQQYHLNPLMSGAYTWSHLWMFLFNNITLTYSCSQWTKAAWGIWWIFSRKAHLWKYLKEKCSPEHHQQSFLQIFCYVILNFQVIVKSPQVPDNFQNNVLALEGWMLQFIELCIELSDQLWILNTNASTCSCTCVIKDMWPETGMFPIEDWSAMEFPGFSLEDLSIS